MLGSRFAQSQGGSTQPGMGPLLLNKKVVNIGFGAPPKKTMPMAGIPSIVLVTIGLTFLVSLVEIRKGSKSSLQACITGWYFIYLCLLLVGNLVAAMFAAYFLKGKVPDLLVGFSSSLYGFLGVFAFSALISRMNVTLFDKGVLTIDEWIGRARDNATVASIAKEVRREQDRIQRYASDLQRLLDPNELHTYVQKYCAPGSLDAAKKAADPELYMALELAGRPEATSIIKARQEK